VTPGAETVFQGGRPKAYRPMPVAARRAALEAGLRAYAEGDYFLAHELLEPPWMGTRDLAERELIQGVIKLAAAFVHGARGNPLGIEKNLRGARERVANGMPAGPFLGIDAAALLLAIDHWLAHPSTDLDIVGGAIPIPRVSAVDEEPPER
jgi:predicted metal-dependent hydrolase